MKKKKTYDGSFIWRVTQKLESNMLVKKICLQKKDSGAEVSWLWPSEERNYISLRYLHVPD